MKSTFVDIPTQGRGDLCLTAGTGVYPIYRWDGNKWVLFRNQPGVQAGVKLTASSPCVSVPPGRYAVRLQDTDQPRICHPVDPPTFEFSQPGPGGIAIMPAKCLKVTTQDDEGQDQVAYQYGHPMISGNDQDNVKYLNGMGEPIPGTVEAADPCECECLNCDEDEANE